MPIFFFRISYYYWDKYLVLWNSTGAASFEWWTISNDVLRIFSFKSDLMTFIFLSGWDYFFFGCRENHQITPAARRVERQAVSDFYWLKTLHVPSVASAGGWLYLVWTRFSPWWKYCTPYILHRTTARVFNLNLWWFRQCICIMRTWQIVT